MKTLEYINSDNFNLLLGFIDNSLLEPVLDCLAVNINDLTGEQQVIIAEFEFILESRLVGKEELSFYLCQAIQSRDSVLERIVWMTKNPVGNKILELTDLTVEEKVTYNNFKALCLELINV